VFAVYLTQVLLLALIGGVIGLVLGAMVPYLIVWSFGAIIPFPIVRRCIRPNWRWRWFMDC
jgi:putative ABC transport system permease protein